ncbi:MAG: LpxL/LpxP family acyltransferase [Planctomycetota bacterium]
MRRKWRKIFGFELAKGLTVRLFYFLLFFKRLIPRFLFRIFLFFVGLGFKIGWFLPLNPWRANARNLLRLGAAGTSPRQVFYRLVDGTRFVALAFLDAHRNGVETVLPRIRISEKAHGHFEKVAEEGGRAIIVLPHVLAGIFSAALVSTRYPTLILSRGPRYPRRAEIQRAFMEPLGLKLLVLDRTSPLLAARQFLTALKGGHLIVGTTDLNYKREDSVPATLFGQDVHLPSWPGRFSRQTKAPIIPGYVRIRDGIAEIDLADPILEKDIAKATQAWASAFEGAILSSPWDWAFLCDMRWGKLVAKAASEIPVEKNVQSGPEREVAP